MNWNISRNMEKRISYCDEARALEAEKKRVLAALDQEEPGIQDDEFDEWEARYDQIQQDYSTRICKLRKRAVWMEYPESKNSWFNSFVESFGACVSKRITRKQAEIFERYSEREHEYSGGRGTMYRVRVGGMCVETCIFPEAAYVTISEF